ncbi:MAG TPA: hypothetical protein VFV09_03545 [Actinomycetota bacterium]|nr:hypothetical protein [Actinomycetota bacterium]
MYASRRSQQNRARVLQQVEPAGRCRWVRRGRSGGRGSSAALQVTKQVANPFANSILGFVELTARVRCG